MVTQLVPTWTWGATVLTSAPFAFDFDADLGAPSTVTEAFAQLLDDGEIEINDRAANRSLKFRVLVEGTDLSVAAQGEATLALEATKARNTLAFDPGDGAGPVTVFETFEAQLTLLRDDDAERAFPGATASAPAWRTYEIEMKAAPFTRSRDMVMSPAVGSASPGTTPTVTAINPGTSTTGWTSTPAPSIDSGTLLVGNSVPVTYTPPTAVDLSSTRFVSAVLSRRIVVGNGVYGTTNLTKAPTLLVNGTAAELVQVVAVTTMTSRYYWRVPAGVSASSFTLQAFESGNPNAGYRVSSLQRQDVLATVGTARQKQRTVAVAGAARTQGSLALSHASASLGSALVYTWPAGMTPMYMPPLRGYRSSGGPITNDTSLVSGARDSLDTPLVYDVPVAALIEGTHQLMARLRSNNTAAQAVNYTIQLREGSSDVGTPITGTRPISFGTTAAAAAVWRNVVLARIALPPVGVPVGSTAVARITLVAADPSASDIDLDETWLFNTSIGDLSWVECGTAAPGVGGASNRLWLDTASVEVPRPQIYRGTSVDRSDAFHPGADVMAFGTHRLVPPLANIFTVTSNALDADVTLTHYPRWHTHAAA